MLCVNYQQTKVILFIFPHDGEIPHSGQGAVKLWHDSHTRIQMLLCVVFMGQIGTKHAPHSGVVNDPSFESRVRLKENAAFERMLDPIEVSSVT